MPMPAGVSVGWGFLMAAYYCALAFYAIGPERMARRFAPHLNRAKSSASKAGSDLMTFAKRINWRDPESLLEIHL